ncbi:hypothetical protein RCG39_01210 [Lactococcus petauri]|jgi:hypothetical protein|uniref:hypothetical protein n=1 Tax=Lactococcus TaxID=1357 RepID=UPI0003178B78|nr:MULTISPECIES: hypothetical protein [Lactococcus]QQB44905.1 hypothetical protein I6H59_04450 [Lactococcus garvieae]MCR8687520.1 hypothetical protein [Lactococcus petauri]MDC0808482.1 hypothetical protein [Lactococcus petauri]MDC0812568.1 hypothetical protein [Lactococcus petauri]MDQ7120498.1 hypothetical protein [Lactococcus petauri]
MKQRTKFFEKWALQKCTLAVKACPKSLRFLWHYKKRHIIFVLLLTTLSLSVSGTFVFTNFGQRVLGITFHQAPPGARLHDDFEGFGHLTNGSGRVNKDIYVENFSSRKILARVLLSEYMERGQGAGELTGNQARPLEGAGLEQAQLTDHSSWAVVKPERASNSTMADFVTLYLGDDNSRPKIFMPTFNQNNHSAESNTTGDGREGQTGGFNTDLGIPMPGTHDQWSEGQKHTSDLRTWDKAAEVEVVIPDVTHVAQATVQSDFGGYMTLQEWQSTGKPTGNFWVHDDNGWLYWATWLPQRTATSLLLDALEVDFDNKDTYYGLYAESDLATSEDVGDWTGVSPSAQTLLDKIIN